MAKNYLLRVESFKRRKNLLEAFGSGKWWHKKKAKKPEEN